MWDTGRIITLLDLTELSSTATERDVSQLWFRAQVLGAAAVCTWPRFIGVIGHPGRSTVPVPAVVVNFPSGDGPLDAALAEVANAARDGALEFDVVLPYRALLAGDREAVRSFLVPVVEAVHAHAGKAKIILETGALEAAGLVTEASLLAVEAGADFLKTSTGKHERGASVAAVTEMLEVVRKAPRPVGLKVSGGVRRRRDAEVYLDLAASVMGESWVRPENFRIGASSLLDDLLDPPTGSSGAQPRAGY
jgi:deoxyribose-phosphate aldolase